MKNKVKSFNEFINESYEKDQGLGIYDKNLKKLEKDIIKIFKKHNIKNYNIELFYSGYNGIFITINNRHHIYIFDQPGKIGLEDHSVAYIQLKINNNEMYKLYHKDGRFGDVNMTDSERKTAYKEILKELESFVKSI